MDSIYLSFALCFRTILVEVYLKLGKMTEISKLGFRTILVEVYLEKKIIIVAKYKLFPYNTC